MPGDVIAMRVPAHELTLQIMRLCAGPILLTSANLAGEPEATTGAEVAEKLGDRIDLILDDGPCKFAVSSTVVEVQDNDFRVLREGPIDEATLRQLSGFIALIVCTGNTCRSPMGEWRTAIGRGPGD